MSEFFTILHLSDLHLGLNWEDAGNPEKGFLENVKNVIGGKGDQQQSHDPLILADLPAAIKSAAWQASNANRYDFDCYVVTGDISTRADDDERHKFARNFLIGAQQAGESTGWSGLGLPKDKLLCLPGNHDVIGEKGLKRYLGGFADLPGELSHSKAYSKEFIPTQGQRFIFYGIDSNPRLVSGLYAEGVKPWEAGGRIHQHILKDLDEKLSETVEDGTIRILLVHHHPCDLNRRKRTVPSFSIAHALRRFTVLENGKELLKICKDRVDVIMHGHEHSPTVFKEEDSGCFIVSAGTTSQWHAGSKPSNSFHALRFSKGNLRVIQFDWAKYDKDNTTLIKGHEVKRVKWWDCNMKSKACTPYTDERDALYIDDPDQWFKNISF